MVIACILVNIGPSSISYCASFQYGMQYDVLLDKVLNKAKTATHLNEERTSRIKT